MEKGPDCQSEGGFLYHVALGAALFPRCFLEGESLTSVYSCHWVGGSTNQHKGKKPRVPIGPGNVITPLCNVPIWYPTNIAQSVTILYLNIAQCLDPWPSIVHGSAPGTWIRLLIHPWILDPLKRMVALSHRLLSGSCEHPDCWKMLSV